VRRSTTASWYDAAQNDNHASLFAGEKKEVREQTWRLFALKFRNT